MAKQESAQDNSSLVFPAFTDFTGKEFHNASFRGAVFEGKVIFQKARFTGVTDFSGATFKGPSDFSEADFNGDVIFRQASFHEPAKFNKAEFRASADFATANFKHDAHFSGTGFRGSTNFGECEFHAWGLFDSSRFDGSMTFSQSIFFGSANYNAVEFATDADFVKTRFIAFADFQKAHFRGRALFQNASVECKALFRQAVFSQEANFSDCRFTHPVNFANADFHAAALFDRVIFMQFVDFSNAHLADSFLLVPPHGSEGLAPEMRFESVSIDHPERVLFSNISFEKITLMGTGLRGIRFEKPRWPRRGLFTKRAVVYDEIQKEKPDPVKLAQLYEDIRANLRAAGTTSELGDLFYSEMEVRRTQRRAGADTFYFLRRYFSLYTLLWLTCGYGRRPLRAAITVAIVAALVYFR
jgi:uncharacterized protein YjbI with pentapeptide repeats